MIPLMPKMPLAAGYRPKTLLSVARAASTAGTSSHSVSGVSIGTAAAGRYVFILYPPMAGTARSIMAVEIGGVAAARVRGTGLTDDMNLYAAIVPTGSTATLNTSFSGTIAASIGLVFAALGVRRAQPMKEGYVEYLASGSGNTLLSLNALVIGYVTCSNTGFSTTPSGSRATVDNPITDPEFAGPYSYETGGMAVNMTSATLSFSVGSPIVAGAPTMVQYSYFVIG